MTSTLDPLHSILLSTISDNLTYSGVSHDTASTTGTSIQDIQKIWAHFNKVQARDKSETRHSSASFYDSSDYVMLEIGFGFFYIFSGIAAFCTNIVALLVLRSMKKQTEQYMIITNFAFIDIIKSICSIYMGGVLLYVHYSVSEGSHKSKGRLRPPQNSLSRLKLLPTSILMMNFVNICSVLNLMLAVLNEYLSIKLTVHYSQYITRLRVAGAILLIWVLSFLFTVARSVRTPVISSRVSIVNRSRLESGVNATPWKNDMFVIRKYYSANGYEGSTELDRYGDDHRDSVDLYSLILISCLLICIIIVVAIYLNLYMFIKRQSVFARSHSTVGGRLERKRAIVGIRSPQRFTAPGNHIDTNFSNPVLNRKYQLPESKFSAQCVLQVETGVSEVPVRLLRPSELGKSTLAETASDGKLSLLGTSCSSQITERPRLKRGVSVHSAELLTYSSSVKGKSMCLMERITSLTTGHKTGQNPQRIEAIRQKTQPLQFNGFEDNNDTTPRPIVYQPQVNRNPSESEKNCSKEDHKTSIAAGVLARKVPKFQLSCPNYDVDSRCYRSSPHPIHRNSVLPKQPEARPYHRIVQSFSDNGYLPQENSSYNQFSIAPASPGRSVNFPVIHPVNLEPNNDQRKNGPITSDLKPDVVASTSEEINLPIEMIEVTFFNNSSNPIHDENTPRKRSILKQGSGWSSRGQSENDLRSIKFDPLTLEKSAGKGSIDRIEQAGSPGDSCGNSTDLTYETDIGSKELTLGDGTNLKERIDNRNNCYDSIQKQLSTGTQCISSNILNVRRLSSISALDLSVESGYPNQFRYNNSNTPVFNSNVCVHRAELSVNNIPNESNYSLVTNRRGGNVEIRRSHRQRETLLRKVTTNQCFGVNNNAEVPLNPKLSTVSRRDCRHPSFALGDNDSQIFPPPKLSQTNSRTPSMTICLSPAVSPKRQKLSKIDSCKSLLLSSEAGNVLRKASQMVSHAVGLTRGNSTCSTDAAATSKRRNMQNRSKYIPVIITICVLYATHLGVYFGMHMLHLVNLTRGIESTDHLQTYYIIQFVLRVTFSLQALINPLIFLRIRSLRKGFRQLNTRIIETFFPVSRVRPDHSQNGRNFSRR